MADESNLQRLRAVPALNRLDDGVLAQLTRLAREERHDAGATIFTEGEAGDSMCFILEGQVVVQKRLDSDGRVKDIAICDAGDIIGEMALFDNKPRAASVLARGEVHLLKIYRADFERFLQHDSTSASAILGGLLALQNQRLREATSENVTLYELVHIVASVRDVRDLATQVTDRLLSSLAQVDAGAFCHWTPYHDTCEVLTVRGASSADAAVLSISRTGPIARALRENLEPFSPGPLEPDHPVRRLFRIEARDHMLAVGLTHGDDLLGYIVLIGRGTPFTSSQRIVLSAVAAPVASALMNSRYATDEQARERLQAARLNQQRR